MAKTRSVIPIERIASRIYLIRGQKVMIDTDLAELYQVETFNLNKAVKRNPKRFPEDFMFQLSKDEWESLKFQIGMSSWGGRRTRPYAFTEHGVAMLSSVLRSDRAAEINVLIIRVFIKMREMLATNAQLARKVEQLDRRVSLLYENFQRLFTPSESKKKPIGYIHSKD